MLSPEVKEEIRQVMKKYPDPRSALVPALYIAQREAGWLPPAVQDEVAALFDLEPAEVHAVAGFYNMLYKDPHGKYHLEVCTNVGCKLRGSDKIVDHLKFKLGIDFGETTADGLFTLDHAECMGSCSTGPMMSVRPAHHELGKYYENLTPERVDQIIETLRSDGFPESLERDPAGPPPHGGMAEPVLLARVDKPNSHKIDTYLADGGYAALRKAVGMGADAVLSEVKASGVRGRGGAGFPAGVKWSFLPKGVYPRYLVCNADESEPGTFKDRLLMEYDPHQVIEGVIISSFACEVKHAFIYIRGEYGFAYQRLVEAVDEAYQHGFLGKNILGSGYDLELTVHRGAGAYICGEETALLTSLEGKRGHPRLKPPFPAVEGLYSKPTVINNVETLCNVPHIIERGADWYKTFGTEKSTGFRLFSLSGQVKKPGVYELPHGTTLRTLIYEYGGGTVDDKPIKGIVPGGLSMPILPADKLDTPLDFESVQAAGSMLGSAGVIVFTEEMPIISLAKRAIEFYREESCGKCSPCREGGGWLEKILERIEAGGGRPEDLDEMMRISKFIEGQTFCPFGPASVWGLQSAIRLYRDEFLAYIKATNPEGEAPQVPVRPIFRPDVGKPAHPRD